MNKVSDEQGTENRGKEAPSHSESAADATWLNAGFAKVCVTPDVGMSMEGLSKGGGEGNQGVHDDLFVRALVLDDRGRRLILIGMDLLFFDRPLMDRFKRRISRQTGIHPEWIFINSSHTHAGPRCSTWAYSDGPDPDYVDLVEKALLEASASALSAMREVQVTAGKTQTDLPVSRRKLDATGKAHWAPYEAGVVCRALPFCLFRDRDGAVVAILFSVSCHPSMIYENLISADYPGAAMRRLNAYFKTEGAMFLQGAGGDSKPRPIADGEDRWRPAAWDEMEAAGGGVADEVIEAVEENVLAKVTPSLSARIVTVDWLLQPAPSREHFESVLRDPESRTELRRWAEEQLARLADGGALAKHVPIQVHAVRLGPGLCLLGVEGEVVGELGNRMLDLFPDGVTFALGYTHATRIYLPTTRMLSEGSYEIDSYWEYHWPAPLAPGGDDRLLAAVAALRAEGVV